MTFNSNAKPNRIVVNSNSLPSDNEASKLIKEVEINYVDYEKNLAYLKDYNKGLNSMTQNEYIKSRPQTKNVIDKIKNEISVMIRNSEKLSEIEIVDSNLKSKSLECLRTVINKVRPRQADLEAILNEIIKKERIKNDSILPESIKESNIIGNSNSPQNNQLSLKEGLIEVRDIEFNQQLLHEREKELYEIQKASAQVKEITKYMGLKVEEQGQLINSLEANVVEVKENVENADDQILEADKDVTSTGRKLCIISILIVVVVSIVVTVILITILK